MGQFLVLNYAMLLAVFQSPFHEFQIPKRNVNRCSECLKIMIIFSNLHSICAKQLSFKPTKVGSVKSGRLFVVKDTIIQAVQKTVMNKTIK